MEGGVESTQAVGNCGMLGLGFGGCCCRTCLGCSAGLRSASGSDVEWFHFVFEMKILDLCEHFSAAAGCWIS